jgi:hypothetical protein
MAAILARHQTASAPADETAFQSTDLWTRPGSRPPGLFQQGPRHVIWRQQYYFFVEAASPTRLALGECCETVARSLHRIHDPLGSCSGTLSGNCHLR